MDRLRAVNAPTCLACCSDMFSTCAVVFCAFRSSTTRPRCLVTAFLVISRLDYCNAVLAGLPATTLSPLQTLLTGQSPDYITDPLTPVANISKRVRHCTPPEMEKWRNGDLFLTRTERRTAHSLSLHLVHVISCRQS